MGLPEWYVEFHGPQPMDEIGAVGRATNADDAITDARANVVRELKDPEKRELLGDVSEYEFASWRVVAVRPMDKLANG